MLSLRSIAMLGACSLLASCGGGGSSGDADTFTMYGSAHAPAGAALRASFRVEGGTPTSLTQRFYKAWVSATPDCHDPVLVQDAGDAGTEFDYFANPVIFTASPPDGTYRCVILRIGDTMRFRPDAVAAGLFPGVCQEGQEYTFDTYRDGNLPRKALDAGAAASGQGTHTAPTAQRTDIFVTTDAAALDADVSEEQVLPLAAPLVVPGQVTFYMDFTDRVQQSGDGGGAPDVCWLDSPVAGFE